MTSVWSDSDTSSGSPEPPIVWDTRMPKQKPDPVSRRLETFRAQLEIRRGYFKAAEEKGKEVCFVSSLSYNTYLAFSTLRREPEYARNYCLFIYADELYAAGLFDGVLMRIVLDFEEIDLHIIAGDFDDFYAAYTDDAENLSPRANLRWYQLDRRFRAENPLHGGRPRVGMSVLAPRITAPMKSLKKSLPAKRNTKESQRKRGTWRKKGK